MAPVKSTVASLCWSGGPLASSAFSLGAKATTPDQRILYERSTGNLRYDEDGNGPIGAIAFAGLPKGLGLTHSSFSVS